MSRFCDGCFHFIGLIIWVAFLGQTVSRGGIIGTNVPAQPLTIERIEQLSPSDQKSWKEYLIRSQNQRKADQEGFRTELLENKLHDSTVPIEGNASHGLPLNRPAGWYSGEEALRLASNIVSYQTPAGGWSKNIDFTVRRRAAGERYSIENISKNATTGDFDLPLDRNWNYAGTFDNDATILQLRFLARVCTAVPSEQCGVFRESFKRGMDYVFAAQYPNGGWPQVWPIQGGYHDAITYNDGAMVNILSLLTDVSAGKRDFEFVPRAIRERVAQSLRLGLKCVLSTQVKSSERLTIWGQQHDALNLEPASARNYEMPSLASGESAGIVMSLMQIPNPDAQTVRAVEAAAKWFEKTAIRDQRFERTDDEGRKLVKSPGAGPIWSRYYQISDDRPIFGDRDKTIHDDVNEISRERRNGYSWFVDSPRKVLERYKTWHVQHSKE